VHVGDTPHEVSGGLIAGVGDAVVVEPLVFDADRAMVGDISGVPGRLVVVDELVDINFPGLKAGVCR